MNVLSVLAARWQSWPFNAAIGKRMDRTQAHMISMLLNYPRKPGMSNDKYFRDRGILAGRFASKHGRWSVLWASRVLSWHSHCMRAHDGLMWHKPVLQFHNALWLEQQRAEHGRGFIKRTKTRLFAGKVSVRWSECIENALEVCPAWTSVIRTHNMTVRSIHAASLADD